MHEESEAAHAMACDDTVSRAIMDALDAYIEADEKWMMELKKTLKKGEWLGDVRATLRGNGEPGTPLRQAYEAYVSAGTNYHVSLGESR